ncbi:MAG: 4-hydroxy-tetrahydrodipicolinate synthase [Legionellales bacterium]|nr:4-hydroxy-tetrahydrodipicolinate synthase [Legionellales bacterium]|tara:strand:+ start:7899 stop:8774 length:876 start_codon:yes stop_codon:yes gene_type:complete
MFSGSLVALVTPMDKNGEIDFSALTKLVDFHLSEGTDGLVIVGTTGEAATLTAKEQEQLLRHAVEQVKGKIPVIAGTGVTSTAKTIESTKAAMQLGVDACLLMAPAYVKPTQEGLYQHFKAIAEAVPVPQIIYNVPSRTASDILPETVARLAELPNIIGIKEASGDLERTRSIVAQCGDKIDVYSGDDNLTKDIILAGGKGVISVTANVAPRLMHDLCQAALSKDIQGADEINNRLIPLHEKLFVESNPIPVKWAVHKMGLMPAGVRLPLTPLSSEAQPIVESALRDTGII